ncbi:MAG: GNAT family N-acetyltransferase, partial [Candidatus Bathyarchaeia archaeon]
VKDGKTVSHVGVWEGDLLIYGSWFKVGMMGAVCTYPDFRGRGYASSLVGDALSKMKRDGVDLVLISGDRNLYRRAGCFKAGKIYRYKIPAGKINLREDGISIVPYEKGCLNDLVEIYLKEPVRYRRRIQDFKMLAERGLRCTDIPLRIFMAKIEDKPLAYIATGLFPCENVPKVWEYAGSRSAVLSIIEHLFKITGSSIIEITVPFHEWELRGLLGEQGLDIPPLGAQANMSIINPQSFLEKAGPYLEERIGENKLSKLRLDVTDEKIKMTLGVEEKAYIDSNDLTFLFFGSPEQSQPKDDLKPILDFLDKAVPMPTPIYGMNFI